MPTPETNTPREQNFCQQSIQAESVGRLLQHRKQHPRSGILAALEREVWHDNVQVYQEEIGIQYPVVDLEELSRHIDGVGEGDGKDTKAIYGSTTDRGTTEPLDETAMLAMLIASVLIDSTMNELAKELVEEVFSSAVARTQLNTVHLDDLTLLTLTVSLSLIRFQALDMSV